MTTVERIDAILKDRKISRRQLAISAQIPPSSLQSAMERNKPLSFEMQEKISSALNVSVYEVLGDDERALFVKAEAGTISEYFKQGYKFTDDERTLIRLYYSMKEHGQQRGLETMWELSQVPLYRAEPAPQSLPAPQDGTDTTLSPNAPETPPEEPQVVE